jgi:hypothetical protein
MTGSSVAFISVHHRRPLVWEARMIKLNSNPLFQIHRFAYDATCLDELDVAKMAGYPVKKMHVLAGEERMLRKMVLAITPTQKFVYIDKNTGTIYDSITGLCKTSQAIRIEPGDLA